MLSRAAPQGAVPQRQCTALAQGLRGGGTATPCPPGWAVGHPQAVGGPSLWWHPWWQLAPQHHPLSASPPVAQVSIPQVLPGAAGTHPSACRIGNTHLGPAGQHPTAADGWASHVPMSVRVKGSPAPQCPSMSSDMERKMLLLCMTELHRPKQRDRLCPGLFLPGFPC